MSRDKFTFEADPAVDVLSQCACCRRRLDDAPKNACEAFPAGVPDAVLANAVDHRRPIPGDGGLTFEPRPGVTEAALAALYRRLDRI